MNAPVRVYTCEPQQVRVAWTIVGMAGVTTSEQAIEVGQELSTYQMPVTSPARLVSTRSPPLARKST